MPNLSQATGKAPESNGGDATGPLLAHIDTELSRLWRRGRNTVIGWHADPSRIDVLVVPQHMLPDLLSNYEDLLFEDAQMSKSTLALVSDICEIEPYTISYPAGTSAKRPRRKALADLIRRYSISKLRDKAAVLFDIVRFSRYSPLEQVTAINSLSYSINIARQRAESLGLKLSLRHTTTGDGFYVWNECDGLQGNLVLFALMMLVLVDNVLGRRKAMSKVIPPLRTCFHVGSCYEFFHAEGVHPGKGSYVVGDVTISLARMSDRAVPGQILVGNFIGGAVTRPARGRSAPHYGAQDFIAQAQETLKRFHGVALAGEHVTGINCYLTGPPSENGTYAVDQYLIEDKHGLQHEVFNAKVNVQRRRGGAIYLGRLRADLEDFQGRLKDTEHAADRSSAEYVGEAATAFGSETILVVEDDKDLREMATTVLQELGYTALEAETGPAAQDVLGQRPDIALLFTDVVIPGGINGEELAHYARDRYPDIKVIYASGYGESALTAHEVAGGHAVMLTKPYQLDDLVQRVNEVLGKR
jgi:CheY-like chemotaxis protein